MYSVLHALLGFLKFNEVNIDNLAFKLHYKVTSLILVTCSVLVTLKQFFGDPIHCFTSFKDDIPAEVLNSYCWMQETFVLPGSMNKALGTEIAAPGVEKYVNQDRIYQQYYQWVCFFLFFQSMSFYLPRFAWKALESGKIRQLVTGLRNPVQKLDEKKTRVHEVAAYIIDNLGAHKLYTVEFLLCEVFNFINVLAHIYLTDAFLGGEFTTYGSEVLSFAQKDQNLRYDPMVRVFPRVTKCTFYKFGPSGDVQRHDSMCILTLNIVNEKIFIFVWFWFVILAVISGLALVYRIVWLSLERLRYRVLLKFNSRVAKHQLQRIACKFGIGDWFFMLLLSKNMLSANFRALVDEIDRMLHSEFVKNDIAFPEPAV